MLPATGWTEAPPRCEGDLPPGRIERLPPGRTERLPPGRTEEHLLPGRTVNACLRGGQ